MKRLILSQTIVSDMFLQKLCYATKILMVNKGLEYESPIPEAKFNDVLIHLSKNFYRDEPLKKSLGQSMDGEMVKELDNYSMSILKQNYSIVVNEPGTKKIAGAALNKVLKKGDIEKFFMELKSLPNSKFKAIVNFITTLNLSVDLFTKYNVDTLLEHSILSVDSAFRNKGIGIQLVQITETIARTNGFKVVKADATSVYTQKVMKKLNFDILFEIHYKDYKDDKGEMVFPTSVEHGSFCIMAKYLK